MNALLEASKNLVQAGRCVIPVQRTPGRAGDKKPALSSVKPYYDRLPTVEELKKWFSDGSKHGMGMICGKISGNVEAFDFDLKNDLTGTLYERFQRRVKDTLPDLPILPKQRTNGCGIHWAFTCPSIGGNKKLASRPGTPEEVAKGDEVLGLIETRGEHGYILASPSKGYEMIEGNLKDIPEISTEQRSILWSIAQEFNEMPATSTTSSDTVKIPDHEWELSPIDAYNAKHGSADIEAMLVDAGWRVVERTGEEVKIKRPGETDSNWSGTIGHIKDRFYCFTSSSSFEQGKTYDPAGVYSVLNHGGDGRATAKDLARKGFGKDLNGSTSSNVKVEEISVEAMESMTYTPTWTNRPADVKALLKFMDTPLLHKQGICLFTGSHGVGKTSVTEAILAETGTKESKVHIDSLGFQTDISNVMLVDTEQSYLDCHNSWTRYIKRAKLTEKDVVDNVDIFNIRRIGNPENRKKFIEHKIQLSPPELLIIDGIGDLILDVNDPKESALIVGWLLEISTKFDMGIMTILHHNPSDIGKGAINKPRGHLGSELMRKAESVILLKRDSSNPEVRHLTTDFALGKNRGGKDTLSEYFTWNDEAGMFLTCGKPAQQRDAAKIDELLAEMRGKASWSWSAIQNMVMDIFKVKESAAEKRISLLVNTGRIIKHDDGSYSLIQEIL